MSQITALVVFHKELENLRAEGEGLKGAMPTDDFTYRTTGQDLLDIADRIEDAMRKVLNS